MNSSTAKEAPPIRLLIYAPHFAEYSLRLANALSKSTNVCLVLRCRNFADEVDESDLPAPRVTCRCVPAENAFSRLVSLIHVLIIAVRFQPDVVHMHESGTRLSYWLSRFFCRFWPTLLTVHDPQPHSGADSAITDRSQRRIDQIRRRVKGFHVHGDYCAETLGRVVDVAGRPLCITAHGPLLEASATQHSERSGCRMLMFGRMLRYKGVEYFVRSVSQLREPYPDLVGVLAGQGPELERLRSVIGQAGNLQCVARFVPPAELRDQIRQCDLVVAPYLDATQSGVIAASFANGKPVLATAVGGIRDIVEDGENGLLVQPADLPGLVSAMRRFLDDDQLRVRLAKGAAETLTGERSWDGIGRKLLVAYGQILGRGGGQR